MKSVLEQSRKVMGWVMGNFLIISIFLHPQIPDFQIVVSRPNIVLTNHTSMESLFIQLSGDV